MAAKKFKVERKFKYLYFRKSQILLKKVDNGEVVVIRSFDDLAALQDQ